MSQYLLDLSIAIIGSAIGLGGAFLIFKITIIDNRRSDKKKEERYLRNRIRFLSNLLDEVLKSTEIQIQYFENQGEAIKANPYQHHLPVLLANNQLDRLKGIDSQDLFEAYLLIFKDTDETIKKYNSLLYSVDFLDKRMTQIMVANESNVATLVERFGLMRNYVNELYSRFASFYDLLGKDEYFIIMTQFNTYIGTGEVDVRSLQEDFLVPLFKKIKELQVDKKYIVDQGNLISLIRSATTHIEHLKKNHLNYVNNESLQIRNDIEETVQALSDILKELDLKLRV